VSTSIDPRFREAIRGFLQAWQDKDWLEMEKHTQLSWAIENTPAHERLKDILSGNVLESFQIGALNRPNGLKDAVIDAVVTMRMRKTTDDKGAEPEEIYRRWRIIAEKEAYRPDLSEGATFGVNPQSIRPATRKQARA